MTALERCVRIYLLYLWIVIASSQSLLNLDLYTYPRGVVLKARDAFLHVRSDGEVYDYIVVGAGAGGCAVAARLALADFKVLLIEAGQDPSVVTRIPTASMGLLGSSEDWLYKTIPNNKSCLSAQGRQCRFSRGKCLGGSTSINYMLYTRGNRKEDFQDIPFDNWSFDDLMPYFLRYEGLQVLDQLPPSSIPFHNTTGTIKTSFFDDPDNPWQERIIESFRGLQFPFNPDVNALSQIGVTKVVGYVHKGQRMSTARGYLSREDVKSKIKIAKNTMCTGVIIDETNTAQGVTVVQGLTNSRVYARNEVILSAGAIGTPQILMLSGVGPADHLRDMNIPLKMDLPIGDGLLDHVLPLLIVRVDRSVGLLETVQFVARTVTQLTELLVAWRGALASIGLTDTNIFANTHCYDFDNRRLMNVSSDGSDCEVPNLQLINAYIERGLIAAVKPLFKQAIGLNDNVINQLSEINRRFAFIVMSPVLLNPRSKGTVRLASSDPLARPAILANYLEDDRDVEDMLRSVLIVEQLMQTSAFRRNSAGLVRLRLPGCPSYRRDRLGYWRCYIRHMTYSVFHAAGTSALGAVTSVRLRVKGVDRLRVADLGVLLRPPLANPTAVTIAIGERAFDFIMEDNAGR